MGHDWDAHGELFFINSVNGHLWHGITGAHFVRPHSIDPNPHVYQLIDHHADHWHFDTAHNWSDLLLSADPWFRGMELSTGPDGAVFALDWSDTGECHENTGVHRNSGRIFKISHGSPEHPGSFDISKLTDGRILNGFITARTDRAITLNMLTETVTFPRDQIASLESSNQSLMPEGLLESLDESQTADIVSYLTTHAQVPLPDETD